MTAFTFEIDEETGKFTSRPKYRIQTTFRSGTKAEATARTLKALFCMLSVTFSGDTSAVKEVTISRIGGTYNE